MVLSPTLYSDALEKLRKGLFEPWDFRENLFSSLLRILVLGLALSLLTFVRFGGQQYRLESIHLNLTRFFAFVAPYYPILDLQGTEVVARVWPLPSPWPQEPI